MSKTCLSYRDLGQDATNKFPKHCIVCDAENLIVGSTSHESLPVCQNLGNGKLNRIEIQTQICELGFF